MSGPALGVVRRPALPSSGLRDPPCPAQVGRLLASFNRHYPAPPKHLGSLLKVVMRHKVNFKAEKSLKFFCFSYSNISYHYKGQSIKNITTFHVILTGSLPNMYLFTAAVTNAKKPSKKMSLLPHSNTPLLSFHCYILYTSTYTHPSSTSHSPKKQAAPQ